MTGHPGAQPGSRARTAWTWRARSFAIPEPGQPGVVRPVEQRVGVGAEAGVRLPAVQVVGDQPAGRRHHGQVADFRSFPADHDCHRCGAADVGDVEVTQFLDSGGGVVGDCEQDGVSGGAWTGGAGCGEQRLDFVSGQVPRLGGGGVLVSDRENLSDLVEPVGLLDGGVAAKRLDHGEALVTGGRRAAPFGFQPVPGTVGSGVGRCRPAAASRAGYVLRLATR